MIFDNLTDYKPCMDKSLEVSSTPDSDWVKAPVASVDQEECRGEQSHCQEGMVHWPQTLQVRKGTNCYVPRIEQEIIR